MVWLSAVALPGLAAEAIATEAVAYVDAPVMHSAEAVVEAVRQSTVSAQISGRVREVLFDVGDRVRRGQIIVRIDDSEVVQSQAEAQATLAEAEARYQDAKANFERTERLFARNFVSEAALDRTRSELDAARAARDARRASAGIAATTRGYATVAAPYDGVVLARHVEVGEMAAPGKALMTGFDPAELRAVAYLPQNRIRDLDSSQPVEVELPSIGRRVQAAQVTIQPSADPRTHTTRVRLDLPRDLPDAYPGMFARAHFPTGRARRLAVPSAAVVQRSEVSAVYVIGSDGVPRLRQLRLGEPLAGGRVEVLAGLSEGERVALDPLKAGMQGR